jgi:hypothetical protein
MNDFIVLLIDRDLVGLMDRKGLVTGSPSSEAMVTRKRGSGASPFNVFHSTPALWNTSIGPMAVEV